MTRRGFREVAFSAAKRNELSSIISVSLSAIAASEIPNKRVIAPSTLQFESISPANSRYSRKSTRNSKID